MWHHNGVLQYEKEWSGGKLSGLYKEWYYNGQLQEDAIYDNGVQVGPGKGWHENGQLAYERKYVNGRLSFRCWDYDGDLEDCKCFYFNNRRIVDCY